MQFSLPVLLSIFIALSNASLLPQQVVLKCSPSDDDNSLSSTNRGLDTEGRDSMKVSRTGKDVQSVSFLDRYFGESFLDMNSVMTTTSTFNSGKKAPLPLPDHLSSLMINDDYEYPDKDDLRDINGTSTLYRGGEFGGINTFAHVPYANCYNPDFFDSEEFDIAIVGAPFDSGVSYRPGARFGPSGIRMGSRRLAPAYSVYRDGFDPYSNWAKIVDCGDPPVTPLDNRIALDQIYRANRAIGKHKTTKHNKSKHPKIFTLGGDHTITLPAIKAAYENWGPITVIHFDSHLDTWNPYYFGGNVTEYQSVNHGTYLHWAHEKGLLTNSSIHAAIRGPYPGRRDVEHDIACGFDRVLARDIDKIGTKGVIEKIRNRVGNGAIYITVDVDSMDPANTPASGTVEPGGWTSRELLTILDGLEGLNVVGGDVVEVAPPFDTVAELTSITAAQVADSIISLMILKDDEEDKKREIEEK
ncbi:guanidinobutyrase [[Candida] anglica]|uniref:Guanidinobutyrase n=1 Tax=[Candida] anglica TaxID=148631 RepID=A0ABP0EAF8_9ASCO